MNDKENDCLEILVVTAEVSLDIHRLLNLASIGFLCVTLLINVLSADRLLLKGALPIEKEILRVCLVFLMEQNKSSLMLK